MMRTGNGCDDLRESSPRRGRGGSIWIVLLVGWLVTLLLAGCEDSTPCVAGGQNCTMAGGYSDFFDYTALCCEGTCVNQIPPGGVQFEGRQAICQ